MEVYRSFAMALGDCWMSLNYHINLALEKNKILKMSLWYINHAKKIRRCDKLKEILPLLQHNHYIELGEWEATEWKVPWQKISKYPFISTTVTWSPNTSKKICYQFDALSGRTKFQNFPSQKIEKELLKQIGQGYELIRLGIHKTLKECVEDLAGCELFVGVDSGMGHVAASVGTPIFYCQNGRDDYCWNTLHGNKHFVLAKDYLETIKHVNNYKELGLGYYHEHDYRRFNRPVIDS